VGEVVEGRDRRYKVTLGTETETLDAPSEHDVDKQMVLELGRILKNVGYPAYNTLRSFDMGRLLRGSVGSEFDSPLHRRRI
jgi:hypothetical protein